MSAYLSEFDSGVTIQQAKDTYLHKYNINANRLESANFLLVTHNSPFMNFFCQTIVIPSVTTNGAMVPTPYSDTWRHGDKLVYEPLNVSILIDEDLMVWEEAYNWIRGLTYPHDSAEYRAQVKRGLYADMSIIFLKNSKNPNLMLRIRNAHPIFVGPVNMSVGDDPSVVLQTDITFQYDTFHFIRS